MLTSLIMTFRESLEIYLFILPLIIYMYKIEKPQLNKNIYFGLLAGFLLCIVTGSGLAMYFKSLEATSIAFVEAILQGFLACIIIYAILSLIKMNKEYDFNKISGDVPLRGISLFMIAFVTVFREGLEVIIYTLPQLIKDPFYTIVGILIGIAISTFLILLLFKTTFKININIIFSFSTLFLIYMGSECFAKALVYFAPSLGLSIYAAQFLYALPMLYFFMKYQLKKYIKKKM